MQDNIIKSIWMMIAFVIFCWFIIIAGTFYARRVEASNFSLSNTKATVLSTYHIAITSRDLILTTNFDTVMINTSARHIILNNKVIK